MLYIAVNTLLNTPGGEIKLGEQVDQKLLYRESDWWYVGLVVQKQGNKVQYVKVRFGRILHRAVASSPASPTMAGPVLADYDNY